MVPRTGIIFPDIRRYRILHGGTGIGHLRQRDRFTEDVPSRTSKAFNPGHAVKLLDPGRKISDGKFDIILEATRRRARPGAGARSSAAVCFYRARPRSMAWASLLTISPI